MKYMVMFVEMSYSCNRVYGLVTSPGKKRYVYWIKANDIVEAYHEAIRLVRNDTEELVQLNFCKAMEE